MFVFSLCVAGTVVGEKKPDFASFTDIHEKKSSFFDYLHPMIIEANKLIIDERNKLMGVKTITPEIIGICEKYSRGCDDFDISHINALLHKVDTIPASLVLAQAANESAWGTSRFATKANNFFGQWCFTEGCGIVPQRRSAGAKHEVRKFVSVKRSVASYMHNLNTGRAYTMLREIRAKFRSKGELVSSVDLANGLMSYSERGADYVKEIQSMIRYNKLIHKYDGPTKERIQ